MTKDTNEAGESTGPGATWSRRSFLQTTGAGSLALGSGVTRAADGRADLGAAANGDVQDTAIQIGPKLNLGGRLIVGKGLAYETIEAAWNDAQDGDKVYVHSSYDAQEAGEQFPIVLDNRV
ncbi:twin-arginine translocation signal domain-containing protein, partial [Halegenticoccus soli]|uniref:twin-arginine translocation signal domain-containing protein n=1 Tax=Halegenticoccus soli TaxID=1985678 RepID=UPI00117ADA8E